MAKKKLINKMKIEHCNKNKFIIINRVYVWSLLSKLAILKSETFLFFGLESGIKDSN